MARKKLIGFVAGAVGAGLFSNTVLLHNDRTTKGIFGISLGLLAQLTGNKTIKSIGRGIIMAGVSDLTIAASHTLSARMSDFKGIYTSELPSDQLNVFHNTIYLLRKRDPFFSYIFEKLSKSKYAYEITFGSHEELGDEYVVLFEPNEDGKGGELDFRHIEDLQLFSDEVHEIILDEFFYVYQHQFYVNKKKICSNIDELGYNVEFERKFFRELVLLKLNIPSEIEESLSGLSPKFLIDYANSDKYEFDAFDQKTYFEALKYYCNFYKNKLKHNLELEPKAAFSILKNYKNL